MLSVALTPDGAWVLSGSKDRGVQFWDPRTGNTQLMLQGHKNSGMPICSGASCRRMGHLTSGCDAMTDRNGTVISVAPSPQGNLFATGSGDMRARIWRLVVSFFSPHPLPCDRPVRLPFRFGGATPSTVGCGRLGAGWAGRYRRAFGVVAARWCSRAKADSGLLPHLQL